MNTGLNIVVKLEQETERGFLNPMSIGLNVVVEKLAEQCVGHNCGILRCLALYFRPWSDSLLLDAEVGTESEHSVVRFSIHSWNHCGNDTCDT
jgi:hypothetical protein